MINLRNSNSIIESDMTFEHIKKIIQLQDEITNFHEVTNLWFILDASGSISIL